MLTDGYPLLDAYAQIPRDSLFQAMRSYSERFRDRNADALEYYSRRWVEDPLHHWSRRWEYLYVTERVDDIVHRHEGSTLRTLDAGSGLTFFPHWLAHRFPPLRVECADRDSRAAKGAARLSSPARGTVSYATHDLASLTYHDASFDAVLCVSVLEHAGDYDAIVDEFARVSKPGAALVLTIDISPDGRWQISQERAAVLIRALERRFEPEADYRGLLHDFDPSRMLTTRHARDVDPSLLPWKYPSLDNIRDNPWRPDKWLRPRFKYLTCFCMSWRRRES